MAKQTHPPSVLVDPASAEVIASPGQQQLTAAVPPVPFPAVPSRGARTVRRSRPPVLPLELILEEYWRDLRRQEIADKTIHNYQQVLRLVSSFWEEHLDRAPTLDDVTLTQAEAFLDHLLERGKMSHWHTPDRSAGVPLSPETLRTYVRTLKVFSSWLAAPKQRYTSEHRLKLLPMPKKPHTYKLPLDADEIAAFMQVCDVTTLLGARDLAMLLVLLDGALRASELIHLRIAEVSLESGQLFIQSGKGKKSRRVTVGENTKRTLRRYALFREAMTGGPADPEAPFFQTDVGRQFRYWGLRTWLVRLKERAGVPRTFPHLLRHTSAIHTLEVPGSDIFTLQEKLGHADISTTLRYLHMTSEKMSERQRTFSPMDHLGLGGPQRNTPPEKTSGHLWHKRSKRSTEIGSETPAHDAHAGLSPKQ